MVQRVKIALLGSLLGEKIRKRVTNAQAAVHPTPCERAASPAQRGRSIMKKVAPADPASKVKLRSVRGQSPALRVHQAPLLSRLLAARSV